MPGSLMRVKPSRERALALPSYRLIPCTLAGAAVGALAAVLGPWWLGPLAAWDAAAGLMLAWTWRLLWPLSPSATSAHATRESPGRANTDLMLLGGSVVSLLAVGLVLVRATSETGLDKGLLVGLSVASIVLAWSTVHTVYTLRYAHLYYDGGKGGGVDFKSSAPPCYVDFAYLALTVGMTFQVSDTDLHTTAFRRLAIRHALLSYFFGALIIATTINLIASLGH
jgi:uncharacterized membrane protein